MEEKVYGIVLTMSQIDNILYNKHGRTEQISCYETCCYLKDISHKSHNPTQESQSLQLLSKEEGRWKEKFRNIIPLVDNDGTPYGWAFENFYNGKDFVKDLSNRNDALIFLGGMEFKSFFNLTTRWVK